MLENGLYHKDIYMPEVTLNNQDIEPNYTIHAVEQAENDRYDVIMLPSTINLSHGDLIELEVKSGKIEKLVIRFDYTIEYDLIMVIIPDSYKVKTVWLNDVMDNHKTLNTNRYVQN